MKQWRYRFEAIGLSIVLGFLKCLGYKHASNFGGWLGKKIGPKLSVHRVADNNLTKAMPGLTQVERNDILTGMWDNLGRYIGEFPYMRDINYFDIAELEGSEHILKAGESQRSYIFFSGHYANWEIAPKSAHAMGSPIVLVYRHSNNPWAEKIVQNIRNGYQEAGVPKGASGAKQLIRHIKKGHNVGMLVDQKMNDGVEATFFGHKAMTASAIATFALKYNCGLIPAKVVRKDDKSFKVIIGEPWELETTGDEKKDSLALVQRINDTLESWVREHPEQWFWVHNRWSWGKKKRS